MKSSRRFLAHSPGDAIRTQSCLVQRLVRVDVADARDRALVEQHRFQCGTSPAQAAIQLVGGKLRVDRLRAESRHLLCVEQRLLGAEQQPAEPTRIAIAQLLSVIQEEHCVRVVLEWSDRIDKPQLPGHPEVHHKKQTLTEPDEDVLAPPSDRLDPHAHHRIDEHLRFRVPDDRRKAQLAAHDGEADQVRSKVRDYGLDLRQLRHRAPFVQNARLRAGEAPLLHKTRVIAP